MRSRTTRVRSHRDDSNPERRVCVYSVPRSGAAIVCKAMAESCGGRQLRAHQLPALPADLVPAFCFGQTLSYSWAKPGPPLFSEAAVAKFARLIGFLPLFMTGQRLFGIIPTPLPHAVRSLPSFSPRNACDAEGCCALRRCSYDVIICSPCCRSPASLKRRHWTHRTLNGLQ